ncbi:MAG: alpha/beta hydrolase [Gemmatimonadales bacterium]
MATPTLTKHRVPGALGELLIDVRAGGRGSPRPAVVVMHGFKGFKDWGMFPPLAERLAQAGVTAVAFNASGSGVDESGEFVRPEHFGHNTFSAELADLGAVVDALAAGRLGTAAPTAIGLVGHSRGGGMAILQGARDPRARALVTWAAISTVERWTDGAELAQWRERGRLDVVNTRTGQVLPLFSGILDDIERNAAGTLDIERAAGAVSVPWLLVHGTGDTSVSIVEAERLAGAARPGVCRVLRLEGAGHTFGAVHPWKGSTPELDTVFGETVSWLSRM